MANGGRVAGRPLITHPPSPCGKATIRPAAIRSPIRRRGSLSQTISFHKAGSPRAPWLIKIASLSCPKVQMPITQARAGTSTGTCRSTARTGPTRHELITSSATRTPFLPLLDHPLRLQKSGRRPATGDRRCSLPGSRHNLNHFRRYARLFPDHDQRIPIGIRGDRLATAQPVHWGGPGRPVRLDGLHAGVGSRTVRRAQCQY